MNKGTALLLLSLILLSACGNGHRWETHELVSEDINRHDSNMTGWIYADLKGDETDFFICTDSNNSGVNSLYVQDIKGRVLSQLNSVFPFQTVQVLADPRDNGRWLFYTYNDQKAVYLNAVKYDWQTPLKREMKAFARIPRTDSAVNDTRIHYFGQMIPQTLEDIDADGRLELLCLGLDSFTANPRGIYVFDIISGELKWQFVTPCNVSGLILRDFDNNGTKELVFGTTALKNTEQVINGLDDFNGWLVMLSTSGEVLYKEQQFTGNGQVLVDIADHGQDGKLEIYVVNSTWGSANNRNTASMYSWTGKSMLRRLNLQMSTTLERLQNADFVKRMDAAGTSRIHLVDKSRGLIVLDDNLQVIPHKQKEYAKLIWMVEDLDQDNNKEIVLQTEDNYLLVLDNHYNIKARIKIPFPDDTEIVVNIVRTGIENNPLISVASEREVRYYSYGHQALLKYITRVIKDHTMVLNLGLLVLVGMLLYRYARRLNVMKITANQMQEGLIVLTNAHKIAFASNPVFMLAEGSKDPACRNLQLCFPSIYLALLKFMESGRDRYVYTETLGLEEGLQSYRVSMSHTRNLRKIWLITLFPMAADPSQVADKLHWADIARRLSHHVRRHITNIMLALDVLQTQSEANRKEYYQIIGSEIDKVRVFTHAFQRFTELKDFELQLQEIVPCIEHCLARTALPHNIKLIRNWGTEPLQAYIEPIRFEEAITNMINNALEAMPNGGVLHISVKVFPKVSSPQEDHTVLVEIEDNGCGIPAKYIEDIWKPFFTTNQSGTGIGIPETKKIMDSLGGIMYIQSEEGLGTTVSFWLKGE